MPGASSIRPSGPIQPSRRRRLRVVRVVRCRAGRSPRVRARGPHDGAISRSFRKVCASNVGVPEVFLYGSEISPTESQELDAARMTERVRMNLGHAGARPNRLGDLPEALSLHPRLGDASTLRLEARNEERFGRRDLGPFRSKVVSQDPLRDFGERYGRFATPPLPWTRRRPGPGATSPTSRTTISDRRSPP